MVLDLSLVSLIATFYSVNLSWSLIEYQTFDNQFLKNMSGSLRVKDDRTALEYTIRVDNNVVRGSDLANIRGPRNMGDPKDPADEPLRIFDPGYGNTAIMPSSVTFA